MPTLDLKEISPTGGRSVAAMPTNESSAATLQDRPPNFRENGKLYLVHCFNCGRV